jgi:hypothetical protein
MVSTNVVRVFYSQDLTLGFKCWFLWSRLELTLGFVCWNQQKNWVIELIFLLNLELKLEP